MRVSTWIFLLALGALILQSPTLTAATVDLLGVLLQLAVQPPALIAVLAAIAARRVRSWLT